MSSVQSDLTVNNLLPLHKTVPARLVVIPHCTFLACFRSISEEFRQGMV